MGDRILSVNGVDIKIASHQDAVAALLVKTDRMKLKVQHDPLPKGFKVKYFFVSTKKKRKKKKFVKLNNTTVIHEFLSLSLGTTTTKLVRNLISRNFRPRYYQS